MIALSKIHIHSQEKSWGEAMEMIPFSHLPTMAIIVKLFVT